MISEAAKLIERFEKAVRANHYRTCDDETEREYELAKAALEAALTEPAPQDAPESLAKRCLQVREWHRTGLVPDGPLRTLAEEIRIKFGNVFDAGEALRQAENQTARDAMDFVIGLAPKPEAKP
jgi:hypothetical protein